MMKPQVVHEAKESYNMRQQEGRNEVVAPTTLAQLIIIVIPFAHVHAVF